MGHKQYLAVSQTARSRLFGWTPRISGNKSMPLNMLISQQGKINTCRLAVILLSICTVALGIVLTFVPWLDYVIFRELKLWNGSLSYSYWQKPGVVRYTKVYIFNVTNPQGFLENGEKPKLVEVGPFVYREDMEKVNIQFHDNDTVTFRHNKILRFMPHLSVDKNLKLVVPNIPLLTVTSFSPNLAGWLFNLLVSGLAITYKERAKPFVHVTAEQLVFGYDDPLVSLAHIFYPKGKRPNSQMGLLLARNGTLDEVSTIYTGDDLQKFGYISKINGMDRLPHWKHSPCNDIRASEGSFFPPRDVTKSDIVYIYDKDLCRIMPMQFRKEVYKDHIKTNLFTPPSSMLESASTNTDNRCYCEGEECPPKGLQNISPCQYNAPVYLSFPHFFDADPKLLSSFEGLNPSKEKHETYFMIQPKLGVPLEGFVRVQLNIKVDKAPNIHINNINRFPSVIFPVMWLEEGIHELSPSIWRWMFLATRIGPVAAPILSYSMIIFGVSILIFVFVRAYRKFVFSQRMEIYEIGRDSLRRGSVLAPSPPKLNSITDRNFNELHISETSINRIDSNDAFCRSDSFVRAEYLETENESLISSDNSFIISEHKRCNLVYKFPNDDRPMI